MPETGLVIAGDIGGTKSLLGAFTPARAAHVPVCEARYDNGKYAGIEEVLSAFIKDNALKGVSAACLALACPIEDNRGTLTNRNWRVDAETLAERFGFARVSLINDLVATAIGSLYLQPGDVHVLQQGRSRPGNRALIAAGTGLGEAALFWDGHAHIPSASEGGHADFAARTDIEMELLARLTGRYGHVSYERVLSGAGLEAVYSFLAYRHDGSDQALTASVIVDEALNKGSVLCSEALDLFVSVYGAEAGNLALKTMAAGGIYIGGGIAPKILKALQNGGFIKAFRDKGRFAGWLSEIPVSVIMNEKTALLGAARHAAGIKG
ncbi:MAG: glucokinase [Deltaproteobacteria bacterium]|nr:glucokinase [Deltaproteobacteria bacterium]